MLPKLLLYENVICYLLLQIGVKFSPNFTYPEPLLSGQGPKCLFLTLFSTLQSLQA